MSIKLAKTTHTSRKPLTTLFFNYTFMVIILILNHLILKFFKNETIKFKEENIFYFQPLIFKKLKVEKIRKQLRINR